MRVAGVELEGGTRAWSDAGNHDIEPLARVVVRTDGGEAPGWVFVAPHQLVGPLPAVTGTVIGVLSAPALDEDTGELPGSAMPPLGAGIITSTGSGMVVSIDPVERMVTVRGESGEEWVTPRDEVRAADTR